MATKKKRKFPHDDDCNVNNPDKANAHPCACDADAAKAYHERAEARRAATKKALHLRHRRRKGIKIYHTNGLC